MINIKIPDTNVPERKYIINILLSDFLGLDYNVFVSDSNLNYSLHFDESELIIQDHFFSKYPEPLSYLMPDSIPEKVNYAKNEFAPDNDIPIIFGSDALEVTEKKIICGIDIFASAFFMLSRWEEFINRIRDEHDRFPGIESMAYKSNFLHRPVVNEYVELFWNMLVKLGFRNKRRQPKFDLVLTHDIDEILFPRSIRILAGDVIKRKDLNLLWTHLNYMFVSNPYDTFNFLMTSSENLGLKASFYFMSADRTQLPVENRYDLKSKLVKSRIKEIRKRGHIIGFHPGYFTYKNEKRWSIEKKLLEEAVNEEIHEGRQHYLMMDIPETLRIWDRNNMKIDSTLGYHDKEGFRCGTGEIFSIFDFLNRKQLKIKERPLIIMDGTLFDYQKYSLGKAVKVLEDYISLGKKYQSTITLLFHNNGLGDKWDGRGALLYKSLLDL